MKIDLSKVNLNLLVALEALLHEQHVTRAAKRLHLTQSAMSNLLKQLRELFHDELLLRGQAGKMILTPKALELCKHICIALEHTRNIFTATTQFDPKTTQHTFNIGMSDYSEFVILPPLLRYLEKHAPGITVVVNHLNYLPNSSLFENDTFDFSIGVYNLIPEDLIAHTLFTDRPVYLGWKKNPLLQKPLSLEKYASAKHLIILYYADRAEMHSEKYFKQHGLQRKVPATVAHTLPAIFCLPHTDMIATVFEKIASRMTKLLPLKYQPVSLTKCTQAEVEMVWHPKNRNNPAHQWMRDVIVEIGLKL